MLGPVFESVAPPSGFTERPSLALQSVPDRRTRRSHVRSAPGQSLLFHVTQFGRCVFSLPLPCSVFLVEPIAEFLSLSTNSSLFVLFFANPAHRRPPFLPSRRAGEQRVTGFFFVVFFYRIGLYVVNEITSRSYNSVLPSYRASNKKATRNRRRRHDGSVKTRK